MGKPTSTRKWYKEEQFIDVKPPLAWDDIKLDTPYRINIPAKSVTMEGMVEVKHYISRRTGFILPLEFSSEWLITNKNEDEGRVGTMPKRIGKWLYKGYQKKISSAFMAEIGNIARAHTIKEDIFIFDITQQLDWNAGDFGDDGSCYFGGEYNHSRVGLIDAEQYALRLFRNKEEKVKISHVRAIPNRTWLCRSKSINVSYDKSTRKCSCLYCRAAHTSIQFDLDKHGKILWKEDVITYRTYPLGAGYGRAWLVEQDNNLITFNAYGQYQLMQISRILSTIMGKSYRKTAVDHHGGGLYLNGDGCVIGTDTQDLKHITLTFPVYVTEPMCTCSMCGEEMPEDDALWFIDALMCVDCYNDNVSNCGHCEEAVWNNDTYNVGYETYCQTCYTDQTGECAECHEQFINDELHEIDKLDGWYCGDCVQSIKIEQRKQDEV